MTLNPKCWLILDFLDFQPDSIRVYIFAALPQVPGHLVVSLLPDLHEDVVDSLPVLCHGSAGRGPRLVLDLQRGVGPLPQPLPVGHTVQVCRAGGTVTREGQEVKAEPVVGHVLDGQQLHPELVSVQLQTLLQIQMEYSSFKGNFTCNPLSGSHLDVGGPRGDLTHHSGLA